MRKKLQDARDVVKSLELTERRLLQVMGGEEPLAAAAAAVATRSTPVGQQSMQQFTKEKPSLPMSQLLTIIEYSETGPYLRAGY